MLVVAVIIYLETAFLPASFLPGDSLLFVTGLTVATVATPVPPPAAFALIGVAAVLGAQTSYEIGRAAGPAILRRPRRRLTDEAYARTSPSAPRPGALAASAGAVCPACPACPLPARRRSSRAPRTRAGDVPPLTFHNHGVGERDSPVPWLWKDRREESR